MKKNIILCLFLIFNFLLAADISLQFSQPLPRTIPVNVDDFVRLQYQGAKSCGEIGEPGLPWFSLSVLLPPDQKAKEIQVLPSSPVTMQINDFIYPVQAVRTSQPDFSEFQFNEELYKTNTMLPQDAAGKIRNEKWFGCNIALSSYCPVKYNPVQKSLICYQDVTVNIITENDVLQGSPARLNKEKAQLIKDFVQNPNLLTQYSLRSNMRELYPDLLIITPEEFIPDFEILGTYYTSRGWQAEFASLEYIGENLPGFDLQEKMRNHIIDKYNEYGISYVLLAGDVEHVPYRGFFCQVESTQLYEDYDIPADIYYSALDGNWDSNNNGIYGEIGEEDLLPEVAVSRLPFSDHQELSNMLLKTIIYSETSLTEDLENPLLLGELLWLDPLTWGADFLDLLIGFHDDNGYSTNGIPENSTYTYLTDRDQGQWEQADFLNALQQGVAFVHHVGHAGTEGFMELDIEDVTEENFSTLNGIEINMPPIYSHGCNCGGFDNEDCIAEEVMKLSVFSPAYVGNSRYGWFNEGQTEGPSQHLHREFVNCLYSDKENHIAMAHMLSKARSAPWVTAPGQHEFGAMRWCFYGCNVLADPLLPLWTNSPQGVTVNYPSAIDPDTDNIDIYIEHQHSNEPAVNFRGILINNDGILAKGISDSLGICHLQLMSQVSPDEDINLYVSGYNVLPQFFIINVNSTQIDDDIPSSKLNLINYPNPFNPETEISFYLDSEQEVHLAVYTIRGQLITTLVNKRLSQGYQYVNWNGTDQYGNLMNSGIYIARLMTEDDEQSIKLLLVK